MAKKKKKTRPVAYFRCWDDNTWDTEIIEIPIDTLEDEIDAAIKTAAEKIKWEKEIPVIVGLYYDMLEEDEDG